MSLRLKAGKFYDDAGNVVPLEFGNKEQIEVLSRADRLITEGESIDHDPVFDRHGSYIGAKWFWDCLCGHEIRVRDVRNMHGRKYKCPDCTTRFVVEEDMDWGGLMVKIRKK